MIELYCGRIGGFKSYNATKRALGALMQSATLCGNLALKWDNVCQYCRDKHAVQLSPKQYLPLNDEQVSHFWEHVPRRSLVLIDEAHLWLPALDSAKGFRDMVTFLTQSRKYAIDMIMITQHPDNLHAQVRRLVQYRWQFRDLEMWEVPVLGIKYPFKHYLSCKYDYDGKTLLQRKVYAKDSAIYNLYDTLAIYKTEFQTLEDFERGQAVKVERPGTWRQWVWPSAIGAAAGVVGGLVLK